MAHSDKDIVITPNKGSSTADPQIVFSGADASTGPQNITFKILPANSGTLSIEGSAGQLLAVTNSLTGVIFTVNDVSGIPSIEVNSSGLIKFAQYGGNVVIGGASEIASGKFSVYAGGASGVSWGTGFNLGSASNYTSQIQDASIARWRNVGAGGYEWYNGTGATRLMQLSNTGNLTIAGEITATRLVDADNVNYYVDPAGTSVLNIVNIVGGSTRETFGPERRYYLGNLTASATQAREFEIARVYIDFNDWHAAGTIFVELQNQYYFGGDTQIWSISYDYNNVNCDLMWGNSPRGRLARVRCTAPSQSGGLTGDFYYIGIFVDVRFYGQYYTYLRTSWPETTTHQNQSGAILVYTTPTPNNIADFTVSYDIFTSNNIQTSGYMAADYFQEYNNTGRYINPNSSSVIGALTTNGRLIVNDGTYDGAVYVSSGGSAYISVNRTASNSGQAGFQWRTADSTRWFNYLDTNDNNILRWYAGGTSSTALTLSQAGALISTAEMQATIFYDKDDTTYWLDPASTTKSLIVAGHLGQRTLMARPYVVWGEIGVTTGQIVIRIPGTSTGNTNYGMIHAVIDIYEYNGNNVATIIIGGHNWAGGWYNFGANVIGYTDKTVRLGVVGNQYCISIGGNASSWNYGQVVLRKIQNGAYYFDRMDLIGTYTITRETNIEASYTYISPDLRQLRSVGNFTTTGYIYGQRFVDSDNNAFYVDPASGSVLGGSITKDARTVPWVAIQDAAPTATQTGDLWWESDTGRLKIWYNDGSSSQWVDVVPIPDLTLYLPKTGGTLTGPLVSTSYISAEGYIHSNTAIRSERYTDGAGNFLFRVGRTSGVTRHINLADTNNDPSSVGNSVNGITWGQRSDNNPYYLIHVRNGENYNGNNSKLTLAWHTGIHIGADPYYGGTNFYNQSPGVGGSIIFSVGRGDNNVRAYNDLYAKSFIDIDDGSYLVNPATDRASSINGFTARTVEGTKGTGKYNNPRWTFTSNTNHWTGVMGWGNNNLNSVFSWGSGFADSWDSPGNSPGDTSHYLLAQAVHYEDGTNGYGWQLAGGPTSSFWWRQRWGTGFGGWQKIAMYGNNANTGAFYASIYYDSNNTNYYVDPAPSGVSSMYLTTTKLYTANQSYPGANPAPIKTWTGVLCAGSDTGAAETYTFVKTKVRYDSYMMGGFTLDWFENYNATNHKTQITIAGYWNPPSNGGMQGFEYTSTNPNIRPSIVVGYDAQGYTCFRLQHFSSSYVQLVARDLWLGYSSGDQNMGDSTFQPDISNGWTFIQTGDANYNSFTGQVTVQPRLAVAMDSVSLMTAAIGRGSHMGGFFQGSYNSVGNNYDRSNPIYTIGGNYNPSETGLANMYGIGYTGASFGSISHRSDWGMYVAAGGAIRVWLDGNAGRVIGTGDFFGDYFYDYYDTYYRVNPNGNTQLHYVLANNWFRPQGNTGVYWQDYDRGLTSPENPGNPYGSVAVTYSGRNGWQGYGIGSRVTWMADYYNGGNTVGMHDNNLGWVWRWISDAYFTVDRGYSIFANSARAPIFIDSNNSNFYVDPDSTSVMRRIILEQNPVGTGYSSNANVPTNYIGQTSGDNDGWKIYSESPSGSNTGNLIIQSEDDFDNNETIRLRFKRTYGAYNTSEPLVAYPNEIYFTTVYSNILYRRDNAFYYIHNGSGGEASLGDVYSNAWFRNRNSGQGLYNQSSGMHWYTNNGYWKAAGGGYGYGGVLLYNNYESDLRGYWYYDGSGSGLLNSSGNWRFRMDYGNGNAELYAITYANDFRPYIIYDRNNPGYYLDMDSDSNLWKPTYATQQRWMISRRGTSRAEITGDSNYWTQTHGWGTSYGNWNSFVYYGAGFYECWGTDTAHPQGSGYIHAQGIQSGWHYSSATNYGFGWQMVGAHAATDSRWWLRGIWGGSYAAWYEIALYNRNSGGGALYATYFEDSNDSAYGLDPDGNSSLYWIRIKREISWPNSQLGIIGRGSNAYSIYQDNRSWSSPFPDLVIAMHTGLSFGANAGYEGYRFFTDYDLSSVVMQINGGSNYIYKYYWMYTNSSGFYSDTNNAHWFPNTNSSYGSWCSLGSRNGWYGINVEDGNGYDNHFMWENGNGGIYQEQTGRWMIYHNRGNACSGFGTSTTNSSYGIYVVKGIYSEGNVVAYSDARAKSNIKTIDNALDKVEQMRGVYFNYKRTPDKTDVGVIAQEMEKILPEVVDYDKENDKYSVAYGNITAVLIEAVKELSAEVKRLKQKLGEE